MSDISKKTLDNNSISFFYKKGQLEQNNKLTKVYPLYCEVFSEHNSIVCYGFDMQGVLQHMVGAISLCNIPIESVHSYEWQHNNILCFYNQFYCSQYIDIQKSIDIKTLIESQGKLLFDRGRLLAKKHMVELIAEEVDAHTEVVAISPIIYVDVQTAQYRQEPCIAIDIQGKDHPFLLYMICDVFAFYDLFVLDVQVTTHQDSIHDRFLLRYKKNKIQDLHLKKLHMNVLLYLKFAYFIQRAPDPYKAIQRLQRMIQQMSEDNFVDINTIVNSNADITRELVTVFGYGDYLWEDFIKNHTNEIAKIFMGTHYKRKSLQYHEYETMLTRSLQAVNNFDEKIAVINAFKDEQRYKVDIDVLMMKRFDFSYLSKHLSELAKVVIRHALILIENQMQKQYGKPCSAAGIESKWVLFALGKFGGEALGFASDLEIQLVYTDYGHTDGDNPIRNSEYFNFMLQELQKNIKAPKKGMFELDVRLRPHGQEGPLAVHLDNFIEYYRAGGKAYSVERLVLTRMRPIVGDANLADRILQLRDDFIYYSSGINPHEIIEMRQKQIDQEVKKGRRNAKVGAGALLDIEINVQLLQIKYGKDHVKLRHPSMSFVLQNIQDIDAIDAEEAAQLNKAYTFFRVLINALRIRRGNATDVSLPPNDDWELTHLARRMGYKRTLLSTKEQLCMDFDTYSAKTLHFVQKHIGKEAIRTRDLSPASLVYVEQEEIANVSPLSIFKEPKIALRAIHDCVRQGRFQNEFAKILLLSWPHMTRSGNADGIIVLLSRLSSTFNDKALKMFYTSLLHQPRRLFILLDIISGSRYLSEEILNRPAYIDEICKEEISQKSMSLQEYQQELKTLVLGATENKDFLRVLREYKKRQSLKIITQDICLGFPITIIFAQLSQLARCIVQTAFERSCTQHDYDGKGIAILAFGKFGAGELNYSSDLDLLCVYTDACQISKEKVTSLFKQTIQYLFEFTSSGRVYRIDLRLQPYGENHEVSSLSQFVFYVQQQAKLWELQASIKLASVAGDVEAGQDILRKIQHSVAHRLRSIDPKDIFQEMHALRKISVKQYIHDDEDEVLEVKHSWGGLRDIEFTVQGLQLVHYHTVFPKRDTLGALSQLRDLNLIHQEKYDSIVYDYCYLRRIEHFLQVYDDKQLHRIPKHDKNFKRRLTWLLIGEQDVDLIVRSIHKVKIRTKQWYNEVLHYIMVQE